jgi:hypothetical protein
MKRNSRKSKKMGKRASKKRVYTKKRFTSLRKTAAKRRRQSSRKMRGGVDPFNANESGIFGEDDTDTNMSGISGISGMSVDLSEDGETDLDAETTGSTNSYSNVMGFPEIASNISSISNNTSAGPLNVGDLDLSENENENEDEDTGNTSLDNDTASFGGNKKRKRSKRSKRRKITL